MISYASTGAVSGTETMISLGTPVARITNRTQLELQYHGLANNTLASVTPTGTVRAAFVYGPYGDVVQAGGAAPTLQRRRFNDKFRDDTTALQYYGARYVSAARSTFWCEGWRGRMVSADDGHDQQVAEARRAVAGERRDGGGVQRA